MVIPAISGCEHDRVISSGVLTTVVQVPQKQPDTVRQCVSGADFMTTEEPVARVPGNSLLIENIEDLLDQDEIGSSIVGMPELIK